MKAGGFLVAGLAVLFSLVWSSAFIAGKIALADFDPASLLTARFALSAVLLAPFAAGAKGREAMRMGVALGALNNAAYLGLAFAALALVRPMIVVAIVSAAPFVTAALAASLGLERVAPRQLLGALIGLAGVLMVIGFDPREARLEGVALAAAGTLAFSAGTLLYRARGRGLSPTALNFWQSLTGAAALAPFAMAAAHPRAWPSATGAAAVIYLAVAVTLGGMAMWFALIRLAGAARASAAHLMNPAFAAVLAALFLGAPLRAQDLVGAAVIAAGLALATAPFAAQESLRPSAR